MTRESDTHPKGQDSLLAWFMSGAVPKAFALHLWWAGARYRMLRRKLHRAIERQMLGRGR
jgi:hypothetical protein